MKRKTRQSVAAVENLEESGGDDEGAGGVEAVSEDVISVPEPESDFAGEDDVGSDNQLEEEESVREENPVVEQVEESNDKEEELVCDEDRPEVEAEDAEQQSNDDEVDGKPQPDQPEDVIEGVVENPLFSPEDCPQPEPIESFAGAEDDLDFEPEIEENEAAKSSAVKENTSWLDNVASPGKVCDDGENNVTIDEIVISDTDDIDELGDKIDAAYPGTKNTDHTIDEDESDEEKRGWRSEKPKAADGDSATRSRRRSPPARRRRVSPPGGRSSRPRRPRSRSSSIEIVSVRSQSGSPPNVVKRREILPSGRYLSRSRSRERYRRRSLTPPRSGLTQLRAEREKTARVRRQVEDLRDMMGAGGGGSGGGSGGGHGGGGGRGYNEPRGVKSRLGKSPPPKTRGHKLIVKNFPKTLSESEFYSMFIRRGELLSCEKKNNIGFVVYKTREGAKSAISGLNGTKNGQLTLSVKEAPVEREVNQPSSRDRYQDHVIQPSHRDRYQDHVIQPSHRDRYQEPPIVAPPPPTGIFSRLGSQNIRMSHHSGESDYSERYNPFERSERSQQMMAPDDLRLNNQMQTFGRYQEPDFAERCDSYPMSNRSQQMMDRDDERFHNDIMQERMQMQRFGGFQEPDFGDSYSRSQQPMMDQDDERFHNEMMQDNNEMSGAFQDRMRAGGNYNRPSGRMFNKFNMLESGRDINMMGGTMAGNMTGSIRGRMYDFTGDQIGGNFRGQTGVEADVGRMSMMRTAGMGVGPRESFGGTFRSGGGDYGPASGGPRYSDLMMEQEDSRPSMRLSSSGDRDLRSAARDQFQSNLVIGGGGSSKTVQSDSFSGGAGAGGTWERSNTSQRPTFGTTFSGGRRGGGPGHTTWSN